MVCHHAGVVDPVPVQGRSVDVDDHAAQIVDRDRHDRVVQRAPARERRAPDHRVHGSLVRAEAERGLRVGAVAERDEVDVAVVVGVIGLVPTGAGQPMLKKRQPVSLKTTATSKSASNAANALVPELTVTAVRCG